MLTYLVTTTADRDCGALLDSIQRYRPGPGVLVAQGCRPAVLAGWKLVYLPERIGPHCARKAGLMHIQGAVVVLDDDMLLTDRTDFGPAVERAMQPGVGLVSCNWRRSERMFPGDVARLWHRQAIVYTGGGLVLGTAARAAVEALPDVPYWCDNTAWSLACYTAGLQNWRYLRSFAVHRVCGNGGRKAWVQSTEVVMPDPALVALRASGRAGEYGCIPVDQDLTAEAHMRHRSARADQY
jgi:hypothetical protein